MLAAFFAIAAATLATAQTPEEKAAKRLDEVRDHPGELLDYVRQMPKGGDLHYHLVGGIYAESWIDFAARDNLCVDRSTSSLLAPPCDKTCSSFANKPAVRCAYGDHVLYNQLVDAWSMRNWNPANDPAHDHFFATFDKFLMAELTSTGDQLAETTSRAATNHETYVEIMHTADGMRAAELGAKLGFDDDFAKMRQTLLNGGLKDVITYTREQLDRDEATRKKVQQCGTSQADPGCAIPVRYLYQVLRGLPKEMVFAQMVLGFELAQTDPRFVGINLVMPEDWYVPTHDFDLHMREMDFLHGVYPKVHITLHAGELNLGLVPPETLRYHIRASIEKGHAERIGHGASVMYEDNAISLLEEEAQRNVLTEICLSSNDLILGISGQNHPLPVYMKYGVPVALATDDEGVSRIDMNHEYVRAIQTYKLTYADLKRMARASLEHSFLSGDSLWADGKNFQMGSACASGDDKAGSACQKLVASSDKARAEWQLEKAYAEFEAGPK
jgi:hypothetical protein